MLCSENDSDVDDFKPFTNRSKVMKSMKVFPEYKKNEKYVFPV